MVKQLITLEEITSSELTKAYVGKNFAQYLTVNPPEAPAEFKHLMRGWAVLDTLFKTFEVLDSAYHFIFNHEQYKQKRNYMKEDEKIVEEQHRFRAQHEAEHKKHLGTLGVVTPLEHDAYDVVHFASMAMQHFVYHADFFPDKSVEILERNVLVQEIRISPQTFESYLTISIKDGIRSLEEKYWINLPNTPKPQIINPDFEEKATEWLKNEIHTRISSKGKCSLLEKVVVQQEETGNIRLRKI